MNGNGIVRRVDELGRIVLPKEMRNILEIGPNTPLEIYIEDDIIMLKKYHQKCIFCNSEHELISFKGKMICRNCKDSI